MEIPAGRGKQFVFIINVKPRDKEQPGDVN